jgi:hypothetical protein
MTELALFASAFGTVFLLVFQQQNVIHRRRALGTATSILIGLAQLTLWRFVPDASVPQLAAALIGGPAGFNAALWAHPIIMRWRPA